MHSNLSQSHDTIPVQGAVSICTCMPSYNYADYVCTHNLRACVREYVMPAFYVVTSMYNYSFTATVINIIDYLFCRPLLKYASTVVNTSAPCTIYTCFEVWRGLARQTLSGVGGGRESLVKLCSPCHIKETTQPPPRHNFNRTHAQSYPSACGSPQVSVKTLTVMALRRRRVWRRSHARVCFARPSNRPPWPHWTTLELSTMWTSCPLQHD